MLGRIHALFRRIRKWLSRSEWSLHLLGLSSSPETAIEPGVVMIQIDGLSFRQIRKAVAENKLPFLRSLIQKHTFSLRPMYSGMPSTTPAVQGELLFGVKTGVPAFEFIDRKENRRLAMFSSAAVEKVADRLSAKGQAPLLSGGSSYSNIFRAGAAEARYCAQTMNIRSLLHSTSPLTFFVILLFHFPKLFRIIGVACLEFFLALSDFFRGISSGKNLGKELKFIPTRVFLCIILRELIRFRVKIDVVRGVQVIQANLIGYDEQSHRRGPDSLFAHWTLQGIDAVIKDIYQTALRSDCRAYRMLVFSDHGQEAAASYAKVAGRSLQEAVHELAVSNGLLPAFAAESMNTNFEYLLQRAKHLFMQFTGKSSLQEADSAFPEKQFAVTNMGPLGHVYLPHTISTKQREHFARKLVQEAGIPLVFYLDSGKIRAWNARGRFDLHRDASAILGAEHPFLRETAEDLEQLCTHENAGDVILSGWSPQQTPLTFSTENGAHGGPGFDETRGFVLTPHICNDERGFLRPLDIRGLVLQLLQSKTQGRRYPQKHKSAQRLTVLSYNIHSCLNMDGKVNPVHTAEILDGFAADLIALQEVDFQRQRSKGLEQARFFAEYLDMEYSFFPVLSSGSDGYGLAILSRYPILEMKQELLPCDSNRPKSERRGAMLGLIESPLGEIWLMNTHLGLGLRERRLQMQALLGPDWLDSISKDCPLIFCGDINAGPRSQIYRNLSSRLHDVQLMTGPSVLPKSTFSSYYPLFRLDHIFVSQHLKAVRVDVPRDMEICRTSDHLPVYAELRSELTIEY